MQGPAMMYVIGHLLLPRYASRREDSSDAGRKLIALALRVEKISAVTFRVSNMKSSVQFYRDVLGMEVLYGGEDARFSSLRAKNASAHTLGDVVEIALRRIPILNLE